MIFKLNSDEIDDLFKDFSKKSKEESTKVTVPKSNKSTKSTREVKEQPPPQKDNFFDSRGLNSSGRKYFEGLPVYSLEELNIGKGGGTPDCPFDCTCCF